MGGRLLLNRTSTTLPRTDVTTPTFEGFIGFTDKFPKYNSCQSSDDYLANVGYGSLVPARTMARNWSASKLALPMRAPSTPGRPSSAAAFSGLTLPPYWMASA